MLLVLALFGPSACAGENPETTLRVTVPAEISERASSFLSGNADEFTPVLMLSGLEVGAGEGFTFEVRGTGGNSAEQEVLLAVSGLEGSRQETPKLPLRKMDLPVPLNRKALDFLAGKKEVTIVLRLRKAGTRAPLKIDRAFFLTKTPAA